MAPLYRPKRLPCFVVTGLSSLSPLILLVKLALRLCTTHSVCAHPHPPPRPRPSGRNTILAFSIRCVKPANSFLCLSFVSPPLWFSPLVTIARPAARHRQDSLCLRVPKTHASRPGVRLLSQHLLLSAQAFFAQAQACILSHRFRRVKSFSP